VSPRATSLRATLAILAAVELMLLGCCLVFVRHNNLLEHDLVGHHAAALWSAEALWPSPRGWDPRFFCGAPLGTAYPPLLSWLAAGLGRWVGVGLALKLWVTLGILSTPPCAYRAGRALGLGRTGALAATLAVTLYLVVHPAELGGNLRSTFETGNVGEALGLPLFFAWIASLPAALDGRAARTALLLALVLVTHLVTGLVSLAVAATCLVVTTTKGRRGLVIAGGLAFLLSAFFTVPLVLERKFGARPLISYDQYPDAPVETLLSLLLCVLGVLVARRVVDPRARASRLALVLAAAIILVLRAFLFTAPPSGGWHLHRFKLFDQLLLLFVAMGALGDRADEATWAPLRWVMPAAAWLALVGVGLGLRALEVRGVPAQPFPTEALRAELSRRPGRVLVLAAPDRQSSDHVAQHLAALAGARVGKGLFIESAALGPLLVELERLTSTATVRVWGIELAGQDELRRMVPRRDALLRHLGFRFILSNDPVRPPAPPARPIGDGFALTELPADRASNDEAGALAIVWREGLFAAPDDDRGALAARGEFLEHGGPLPLRARGAPAPPVPSVPAETRVHAKEADAGQAIEIEVEGHGGASVPVLIRAAYHPGWHARAADGRELAIYEAAPHLMLVFTDGPVRLRFGLSQIERVAAWASVLGLALAALSAWRRRRPVETGTPA
jgi:hypothetical protein